MSEEKRKIVAAEDFVQIWQNAKNIKEVAHKCGITYNAAASRGKSFVKAGVQLKNLASNTGKGRRVDVDALNKLISETIMN